MPAPILLEAMAQVLGWGIIHAHKFRLSAFLSLAEGGCHEHLRPHVSRASLLADAVTGRRLGADERTSIA